MMKISRFVLFSFLSVSSVIFSQEAANRKLEKDSVQASSSAVELNARIESMHRWRGNASADKPTVTGSLRINLDKNKKWQIGVWGASAVANETSGKHYKEIDYFIVYQPNSKFSIGIWDQFPMKNQENPNIFDYGTLSTKHYIDLEMIYYFGDQFPLRIQTDVALYGNDFETDPHDVVNVGLMAVRKVAVAQWQVPVTGVVFWNPSQKLARLQLSVNLF